MFMKYILLCTFFLGFAFTAVGQEHDPTRQRCVYYVDKNPGKGAGQLDDSWCKACMKIAEEKRKEEERQNLAEEQARLARVKQAAAEREAAKRAEAARLEQRNKTALAELNDLNHQNAEFDRIRRAEATRKQAINAEYNNRVERATRDYNDYLDKLQKAAAQSIPNTDDAFWTETVSPANYVAFQDKKSGRWGFADKKGNVKIAPKYDYVMNFSGGIGYAEFRDKQFHRLLLNAKGEIIKSFDEAAIKQMARETGQDIRNMSRPDTIANGMMITEFSIMENGKWVSRRGALDKEGNLVIKPLFHKLGAFKNGTAQASLFLDKEETEFKTVDNYYRASYTYVDAGLIDRKGNWVQPAKKKLEYSYGYSWIASLTITDSSWDKLTRAEKDAINARVELQKKQRHAEAMTRLETEVRQKVSGAQGQGYLIEKVK